jgi:hypothetical protein
LLDLPYYDDLLLPHNIDVMHTEKNVAEALWATIMDIPDKSKDNVKARLAPVLLCKIEKIFPLGFFNLMQHLILHLPMRHEWGGWCRDVGAIQSRDV